jgi:hypothetical protein
MSCATLSSWNRLFWGVRRTGSSVVWIQVPAEVTTRVSQTIVGLVQYLVCVQITTYLEDTKNLQMAKDFHVRDAPRQRSVDGLYLGKQEDTSKIVDS